MEKEENETYLTCVVKMEGHTGSVPRKERRTEKDLVKIHHENAHVSHFYHMYMYQIWCEKAKMGYKIIFFRYHWCRHFCFQVLP